MMSTTDSKPVTFTSSQKGRAELAEMLAGCYSAMRTYGKEPEHLAAAVKLFCLVLGHCPIESVREAFIAYLRNHQEFPTPADIAGYIKRGGRKPFDKALYVALCQKRERTFWKTGPEAWNQGDGLTDQETKYIREYEEFEGI